MAPDRRLTEAELRRKINKPLMEKKRRQRINKCLDDLKSIVLTNMAENSRPSKLEKADILEMTLCYLQHIQSGKLINPGYPNDSTISQMSGNNRIERLTFTQAHVQRNGYEQCVQEVTSFLSRTEGVPVGFRARLLGYLTEQCKAVFGFESVRRKSQVKAPSQTEGIQAESALNLSRRSRPSCSDLSIELQGIKDKRANLRFPTLHARTNLELHQSRLSPLSQNSLSPEASFSASTSSYFSSPAPSPASSSTSLESERSITKISEQQQDDNALVEDQYLNPDSAILDCNTQSSSRDSGIWSSNSYPSSPTDLNTPATSSYTQKQNKKAVALSKPSAPVQPHKSTADLWRPWGL